MTQENLIKPYVIGLDLGGTNSVFGIVDSRGDIKATTAIKTQGYESVDDYVNASVEALQIIIDQVGGIEKIKAMGIGKAGLLHALPSCASDQRRQRCCHW